MSRRHTRPGVYSRRNFLKAGFAIGTSLIVGFDWSDGLVAGATSAETVNPFDAWIRIASDGMVTLVVAKSEMGQGIMTSLPMILADELEADWKYVRVEQAKTIGMYDLETSGSNSVLNSYLPLRQAGAAAREMLVLAAAKSWGVDPRTCCAQNGVVHGKRGSQRLTYGELAESAARLPVPDPTSLRLKTAAEFRYVGKSIPRIDIPSKVDGTAHFGIDVKKAGLLHATISRCPVPGGNLQSFDAKECLRIPGVRAVVEISKVDLNCQSSGGIAVVAEDTAAAIAGRDVLQVSWNLGANGRESSDSVREQMRSLVNKTGRILRAVGDTDTALSAAPKTFECDYELPFLAHATMEPMNCTADVRGSLIEIWAPTQCPRDNQTAVANLFGLKPEQVMVHTTLSGGGFGRRDASDFVVEAAQVSKAVGKPVQVFWTREDDIGFDFYRPAFQHRMSAALNASGRIAAWRHRVSSTPISTFWEANADPAENEIGGAAFPPYEIENFRLEYTPAVSAIRRSWWRSVEEASSAFAVETFVDELAFAAGTDPLQYRLNHLSRDTEIANGPKPDTTPAFALAPARLKRVLEVCADASGWRKKISAGRARGVATYFSFNTYVAQVAEVSVQGGRPKVDRISCVVDCGRVINPDGVKAQMEGAIIYGLSAALFGEITIQNGRTRQSNFHDYPVLRMRDVPKIDVHLVDSSERPTGVGEPGVPPLAPAVGNALFALTGQRLRSLPFKLDRKT